MSAELKALLTEGLSDVYQGFSSMTVTMECLAESRTLIDGDTSDASIVLDMLSTVSRIYLDKLDTLLLVLGRQEDASIA